MAIAVAAIAFALATWQRGDGATADGVAGSDSVPPIDPDRVLVAPFRITASDTSLEYLRDGMVELLHMRLNGEGVPRAVHPTSAIKQWQQAAQGNQDLTPVAGIRLGERLGVGQLLMGSIVGTPAAFEVSARLLAVPGGEEIAQVTQAGSERDLLGGPLVDSLVLGLMGLPIQPEGLGLTTSLPAMRLYLAGREQRRRGNLAEAAGLFERAIAIDTTFAIAKLEQWHSCAAFGAPSPYQCDTWEGQRGFRLLRGRLGPREVAIVRSGNSMLPSQERIDLAGQAALRYPGDPYAMVQLARRWFQQGQYLYPDSVWMPRALNAVSRAVELDSTNLQYLGEAIKIAAYSNARDELSRYRNLYLRHTDSSDVLRPFHLWLAASVLADRSALRDLLRAKRLREGPAWSMAGPPSGWNMDYATGFLGLPHDETLDDDFFGAILEGRAADLARAATDPTFSTVWGGTADDIRTDLSVLTLSLFTTGFDSTVAIAEEYFAQRWTEGQLNLGDQTAYAAFALQRREDEDPAREMIVRYEDDEFWSDIAVYFQALLHPDTASTELDRLLAVLDSVTRVYPLVSGGGFPNLHVAKLLERRGEYVKALAAVRRRNDWLTFTGGPFFFLPYYLEMEGRLAAQLGDTTGAIAAYEHYLELRTDPDPGVLTEERDAVRRALAELKR